MNSDRHRSVVAAAKAFEAAAKEAEHAGDHGRAALLYWAAVIALEHGGFKSVTNFTDSLDDLQAVGVRDESPHGGDSPLEHPNTSAPPVRAVDRPWSGPSDDSTGDANGAPH